MLLQNHKIAPQNCSSILLITETRIAKKLPKTPKLFPEATSKLIQKAVQSYSPKLIPGVAPQNCAPKLFSESCDSAHLFAKTGPKSHSRLPKAAPPLRFIIFSCLIFTFLCIYFCIFFNYGSLWNVLLAASACYRTYYACFLSLCPSFWGASLGRDFR